MAKESKISWTHGTFNPWRGCTKVSPGCQFCYAEAQQDGFLKKGIWGKDAPREFAAESYWKAPLKWNEEASASGQPFRVFCSSLADVCEDREDLLAPRARLMRLIEQTHRLTWLLLTKRPENFNRLFGRRWSDKWPRNVWAMTTAEDQERADARLPELLKVPAAVRGVSYEPALGPINLRRYLMEGRNPGACLSCGAGHGFTRCPNYGGVSLKRSADAWGPACDNFRRRDVAIHWVIAGGESGGDARPFHLNWARDVQEQCRRSGVAFFMKQLGSNPRFDRDESVLLNLAKKGDDPAQWPSGLRVQEFPA